MNIKNTDLINILAQELAKKERKIDEIGHVFQVGDGICRVHGLLSALYGELIEFEGGNSGIIFSLDEDFVAIFLLDKNIPVAEQEIAKRTKSVFKVPVSIELLGRVISATGEPLDSLGNYDSSKKWPVEYNAAGVIERDPINEPLETGILSVDALVPIGKGQRELIVGNRNSGKSSLTIGTIINQKDKNVICIYVSIGQRQANVANVVNELIANDALSYTCVIVSTASSPVLLQYLAPYAGTTVAEYFRSLGKDVLIVYDDLTNHAIAYREMSLLLKRSPGREAYPGDVFYLHARLLERSGKLLSGGSITALPIAQLQSDDLSAYIPTNLISITDGQIYLDTNLFNRGIRPAVNIELSVSRVGGVAQTKGIRSLTKALRLEIAQFNELQDFAQFGTELDEISQKRLKRGSIAIELLKQDVDVRYSGTDEILILFMYRENIFDNINLSQVNYFAQKCISYLKSVYSDLYFLLGNEEIKTENKKKILECISEFNKLFSLRDS